MHWALFVVHFVYFLLRGLYTNGFITLIYRCCWASFRRQMFFFYTLTLNQNPNICEFRDFLFPYCLPVEARKTSQPWYESLLRREEIISYNLWDIRVKVNATTSAAIWARLINPAFFVDIEAHLCPCCHLFPPFHDGCSCGYSIKNRAMVCRLLLHRRFWFYPHPLNFMR